MDLENVEAALLVGEWNLNLAVETPRSQQRRVQHVRPVGRHNHLHLAQPIEPVQLVQQLHEGALDLAVSGGAFGEAAAADGVDLVHEDNARLVLLRIPEHLADEARTFADVFVDNGGGDDLEEVGLDVGGDGAGQQRLASSGRPVQQAPLGRLDPDPQEQLRVDQRQLNHLSEFADLVAEAADLAIGDVAGVLVQHVVHDGVHLAGEGAHDGESGHVERHTRAGRQLGLVDLVAHPNHVPRPTRRLHNEPVVVELTEHLPDNLTDTLQRLEVIFRFIKLLPQLL
mmetsp:Transcript_1693/g.3240  ORF Transcript_1693/g.3240 Transcript_1693/m.3240 type:complete len:284 (-) Transcript_1693:146-997(-)